MQNFTDSILSVTYDSIKGLSFQWNFQGSLIANLYYNHVVINTQKNKSRSEIFNTAYFNTTKPGDLIWFVNPLSKSLTPRWIQKVNKKDFQQAQIKVPKQETSQQNLIFLLSEVGTKLKDTLYKTIINIIIDVQDDSEKFIFIKDLVRDLRKNHGFPFIFNFFGFNNSCINVSLGINTFPIIPEKIPSLLSDFRNYLSNVVICNAQLKISSKNTLLTAHNRQIWNNMDFCTIKRMFYGITTKKTKQTIHIIENGKNIDGHLLNIIIVYETLKGTKYFSERNITLHNNNSDFQIRTIASYPNLYPITISENLTSYINPFSSLSYVSFQKQTQQQQKKI